MCPVAAMPHTSTARDDETQARPQLMTLVEYATGELRERILAGDLPAGERLLLDGIAEDLGISPIPLREALRSLASEGLVSPLPRRGYTIAQATAEDLEETYRLRLVLEPLAAELAVPMLTAKDLVALRAEFELARIAVDEADWRAHRLHHRAFHFTIYNRCGSSWLVRFTEMLWANSERYQRMTTQIRGGLKERLIEHQAVLDACEQRDAKAASKAMHAHLENAFVMLRGFLAENEAAASNDDVT
jgi:DNA-binding GntR family transcriptional regulator